MRALYEFNKVKEQSRKRALEVLQHFFGVHIKPYGGVVYLSSPISTGGKSCMVNVQGEGSGTWKDYGAKEHPVLKELMSHGDMVDIARFVLGVGYQDACNYLGSILAIEPSYRKINLSSLQFYNTLVGGRSYFTDSGISDTTLDLYSSCLTLSETDESQFIAFTHPNPLDQEEIASAHLLYPKQDADSKNLWYWFNKPTYPWGMFVAMKHHDKQLLVVTEGEKDALALVEAGFNAVSIPSGASNLRWIEASKDLLASFGEVCLFFDNDDAGVSATRKAMFELAANGIITSVINWGYCPDVKDAADILKVISVSKIQELVLKRTKISLDFSQITLTGKSEDAIVRIDDRIFTVSELRKLIN